MIKNNKQQLFLIMKEAINSSKPDNKFPKLLKYVVAVVPHTSWVDFFVGLMVRSILGE